MADESRRGMVENLRRGAIRECNRVNRPGGLFSVPVIGKVKASPEQMFVLPGFPKPTAGLDPMKTPIFLVTLQPFSPTTVYSR
jgi:hypothetical protein